MQNDIHFISGLPRAGSTLLSALLLQNPRFAAGMTSPVGSLFNAMLSAISQRNESAVFLDDLQRQRLLRACSEAYYADIHPHQTVFDTNRMGTTKLAAPSRLFPTALTICCVRKPAWVVDSIESLVRRNAFELSGNFNFDPGGTVYSRAEGLSKPDGMVGSALNALREAIFGRHADRLLLVRYERLTANPLGTLAAICTAIGEQLFRHDPDHIEPAYDMIEFDIRLGTPGLHHVRSAVPEETRPTVLPPDLFARCERDAFREGGAQLPKAVPVIQPGLRPSAWRTGLGAPGNRNARSYYYANKTFNQRSVIPDSVHRSPLPWPPRVEGPPTFAWVTVTSAHGVTGQWRIVRGGSESTQTGGRVVALTAKTRRNPLRTAPWPSQTWQSRRH